MKTIIKSVEPSAYDSKTQTIKIYTKTLKGKDTVKKYKLPDIQEVLKLGDVFERELLADSVYILK